MKATTLRRGTPGDVAAIIELNGAGNGEDIAEEMRAVFDNGAMSGHDYAIASVDGRVVAVVGLLATSLQIGSVTLPVGQPEYVATDPEHQGHGLAGRLLALVQRWSAEKGDLVQVIAGVPYFYRQYGYCYGLPRPRAVCLPPEQTVPTRPDWEVRSAVAGDVARIKALQASVQATVDVAMPFTDDLWPAFLAMSAAPLLVAVNEGRIGAVARLRLQPGSPVHVQALAADTADGVRALLAGARERHPGATLVVAEREGSLLRSVVGSGLSSFGRRKWVYVRVPDLTPMLGALAPVLDERLARSPFASWSGELNISLYRSGVRLLFNGGKLMEVAACAGVHLDEDDRAVGIPPDLVPLLLFGEGGVVGLEDHPDVHLGPFRPLMATLFPPLRVDLLTW